jgi:hypothetical protein
MRIARCTNTLLSGRRRRRTLGSLLGVLQLLTVLASFQLSGIAHFARDLVQVISVGEHHHDDGDDDEDEPGHECPPGCPNCHHVHLSGAALSPSAPIADFVPLRNALPGFARDNGDDAPPGPALPSVYRPPRA